MQDAQRARRLAEHDLHIERAANQGEADQPQQHQKAPFPVQARCEFVHCRFLRWIVAAWSACLAQVYTLIMTFERARDAA
ncbi:hypothetical protein D3C71_1973020 [compost metagenome]